jgi:hypothetical protein
MLDFDKMRKDQLDLVNIFEEACTIYMEDCPVIMELLESHEMTQYKLFKINKDSLEDMETIAHSLYHAFVDDGAWHVTREVDEQGTELRDNLNELRIEIGEGCLDTIKDDVVYRYRLKVGDSNTNRNITEYHLSEMIRLDTIHHIYYANNKDNIEQVNVHSNPEGIKEYFRLSRLLDAYLAQVYIETLYGVDENKS